MTKQQTRVYLDYSATTPLRPQVRQAMAPFLNDAFGNPSSIHSYGRDARMAIEDSRRRLLDALNATGYRVVFTGSGSEADNLAVLGFARRHTQGCVVHSTIEHKAVIEAANALRRGGYDVRAVPVDSRGVVDFQSLEAVVPSDGRPTVVCVMWANNETGVIQPIQSIAELCRGRGAALFSDAVQAFTKIPLGLHRAQPDLIALSAHKLAGPKGTGALVVRESIELEPLVYGGGQEGGNRAGTEAVAAIVGFAEAAGLAAAEMETESGRLSVLRDRLQSGLCAALPEIVVNGGDAPERLPNVLNLSVPDVDIEGTLTGLDLEGIAVSSGSACTTGSVKPSHVMNAMGRDGDLARNTVRLSLGWGTREADVEYVLEKFPRVVQRVREFAR